MSFKIFVKELKKLYLEKNWTAKSGVVDFLSYINQKPKPTGDEMNLRTAIVFPIFQLLNWPAGLNPSFWDHDSSISDGTRPDSIAKNPDTQENIFVLDTKSSSEVLENYLNQIRDYSLNLGVRYGILTNGKRILVYDFIKEPATVLFDLTLSDWIIDDKLSDHEPELVEFYNLFSKDIIFQAEEIRKKISINEKEWVRQALPITTHIDEFVKEIVNILNLLIRSFDNQLKIILKKSEDYFKSTRYISQDDHGDFIEKNEKKFNNLAKSLRQLEIKDDIKNKVFNILDHFFQEPFRFSSVDQLLDTFPSIVRTNLVFKANLKNYLQSYLEHELYKNELRKKYTTILDVRTNFNIWKETIGILFEKDLEQEFSTQTAYLLFTRILFIRICEDNSIFERKLSDGGFVSWHSFINTFFKSPFTTTEPSSYYHYSELLSIVFNRTRVHYSHFFNDHDIFRWFNLSDYLFLEILSILNKYNFKKLNIDIIGKIYESYVDRFSKKQKGLFYTPPEVIDNILDEIGYINTNDIITKSLVDFSCGSGSFLVHATRRLIQAHKNPKTGVIDYPDILIGRISTQLIGLDINPFSCYLTEIYPNQFCSIVFDLIHAILI